MIQRFILASAVAVMLATAVSTAQTAPQGGPKPPAKLTGLMAALQGNWTMATADGQDMTGQDVTVTITDNTYVQTVAGQVVERGTFKVDESKKPAALDLNIIEGDDAGKTQLGVIAVDGK